VIIPARETFIHALRATHHAPRLGSCGIDLTEKQDCPIVLYRTGLRNPLIFYPPIDITNQRWYKDGINRYTNIHDSSQ